jgi:uncharacterized repeat protein (TIGR03843 family)
MFAQPNLPIPPSDPDLFERLLHGPLRLTGQFVWGSNHTFLVEIGGAQGKLAAVYKPARGERPLWDFPDGSLAGREVAAYLTSQALGWNLIPPTVLRPEGPAGPGSVQLFIESDTDRHYFNLTAGEKQRLRPAAAFDVLINNADRKGGHILLAENGDLWLIDHGVSFHIEPKLRTVIWDFAGEPIPVELVEDVRRFGERLRHEAHLRDQFAELLSPEEVAALQRRAQAMVRRPRFPNPGSRRHIPWPPV